MAGSKGIGVTKEEVELLTAEITHCSSPMTGRLVDAIGG